MSSGAGHGKKKKSAPKKDVDRLVNDNLGLVYDVARRLDRSGGQGPERGDLISAGVQGLIQAASSFDPGRGLAFSTLAVTRIRGAMLDELRRWDTTPRSVRKRERQLRSTEADLKASLGREPTVDEVAEALDVSTEDIHGWRSDLNRHVEESLDHAPPARGEEFRGLSAVETTADDGPSVEDSVSDAQTREILMECIQSLPERDARILALYYYEGLRLREIAQLMGVTESRISQIRQAALKTLRALLSEHGVER